MKLHKRRSEWAFLTPIHNLFLTEEVDEEIRIDRVTFISSAKLLRVRDRLGVNKKHLREAKSRMGKSQIRRFEQIFEEDSTFAVLRHTGKPANIRDDCYRIVQDELAVLVFSQLLFKNRKNTGFVGLAGEHDRSTATNIFLDSRTSSQITGWNTLRSPTSFTLDDTWFSFHRRLFFFELLSLLQGKVRISPNWRRSIRRAVILVGKGLNSRDVGDAFLWTMIALELLLTQKGDSYPADMVKRAASLLDWSAYWGTDSLSEGIENLYRLRCEYVHDGNADRIDAENLDLADKLVFNILWNLVDHSFVFGSKEALINFAKRHEARNLLGLSSPKKPNLHYANKRTQVLNYREV